LFWGSCWNQGKSNHGKFLWYWTSHQNWVIFSEKKQILVVNSLNSYIRERWNVWTQTQSIPKRSSSLRWNKRFQSKIWHFCHLSFRSHNTVLICFHIDFHLLENKKFFLLFRFFRFRNSKKWVPLKWFVYCISLFIFV
jgi:hypothetical protein